MIHGYYVGPVILAGEEKEETKQRTVTIYKNKVYKDIDLLTYKHVDGSGIPDNQVRNARSSDTNESVDGAVISRNVEFRDAQLRRNLCSVLNDSVSLSADDGITLDSETYVYDFNLPVDFNDNTLKPLAEFIHRYLVYGALYDWYVQFGMFQQAEAYGSKLSEIEDQLESIARGPSIAKKPLQPFGPRNVM